MNRRDLVVAASGRSGLTQKHIHTSLEPILESIMDALSKGEKVCLHNFGTFYVKDIPERASRNPKSGQQITVSAKRVIKFKRAAPVIIK